MPYTRHKGKCPVFTALLFPACSTEDEAKRLGVNGWVKNLPSGAVEAVFEGPEELVHEMVAWCRIGPNMAHVTGVELSFEPFVGEFNSFKTVY